MTDSRYLRLSDLSRYSGIKLRTLRSYLHLQHDPLPHSKLPNLVLVEVAEFDRWVARRKVQPPDLRAVVHEIVARAR